MRSTASVIFVLLAVLVCGCGRDAVPSTASVIFIVMVLLVCGVTLYIPYMQYRETSRAAGLSRFRGIQGLSEELARLVERLPPEELPRVVEAALDIAADDFAGDADIEQGIAAYRSGCQASRALASKLKLKARLCDSAYFRLEEAARKGEADINYRKTWVLEGLFVSLESPSCHPAVVDNLVSGLSAGTADLDSWVRRMIEKLSADGRPDADGTGAR